MMFANLFANLLLLLKAQLGKEIDATQNVLKLLQTDGSWLGSQAEFMLLHHSCPNCILMKTGVTNLKFCCDIMRSISLMHIAGFCYTDIRSGILLFFSTDSRSVRRPSDFNPVAAAPRAEGDPVMDLVAMGLAGADKVDTVLGVYCGILPYNLCKSDLKDMFGAFGALTGFELPQSRIQGESMGYCFFACASEELVEAACSMHWRGVG
jgi:hypothetical protein